MQDIIQPDDIDSMEHFLAGVLSGCEPFTDQHPMERVDMARRILAALSAAGFRIVREHHEPAMSDVWVRIGICVQVDLPDDEDAADLLLDAVADEYAGLVVIGSYATAFTLDSGERVEVNANSVYAEAERE